MTPMSHPWSDRSDRGLLDAPCKAGIRVWHAGCIILVSGCLYVAPLPSDPVNRTPNILEPAGPTGTEHRLELFLEMGNFARVLADDPDDDPLDIFWLVPGSPFPDEDLSQEGDVWVGLLFVPRDPALDGALITATVFDGESSPVDVRFRVEVP